MIQTGHEIDRLSVRPCVLALQRSSVASFWEKVLDICHFHQWCITNSFFNKLQRSTDKKKLTCKSSRAIFPVGRRLSRFRLVLMADDFWLGSSFSTKCSQNHHELQQAEIWSLYFLKWLGKGNSNIHVNTLYTHSNISNKCSTKPVNWLSEFCIYKAAVPVLFVSAVSSSRRYLLRYGERYEDVLSVVEV